MLLDKTQALNRLQNSSCSTKTSQYLQPIKNPYLAQYKIFQQRVNNPKFKSSSLIMRKKKNINNQNKQNFQNEIKKFYEQETLKQAKKLINNEEDKFSIIPFKSIDYGTADESKQSQVLLKFKQKLHELKMIKNQLNFHEGKSFLSINFNKITRFPLTQTRSSIATTLGSQRKSTASQNNSIKPHTAAELFARQRSHIGSRQYQQSSSSQIVVPQNKIKLKCPITFINYKKNKSLAERFTATSNQR